VDIESNKLTLDPAFIALKFKGSHDFFFTLGVSIYSRYFSHSCEQRKVFFIEGRQSLQMHHYIYIFIAGGLPNGDGEASSRW
jgi:hypothetical protein